MHLWSSACATRSTATASAKREKNELLRLLAPMKRDIVTN
jgi:hypothetical protein